MPKTTASPIFFRVDVIRPDSSGMGKTRSIHNLLVVRGTQEECRRTKDLGYKVQRPIQPHQLHGREYTARLMSLGPVDRRIRSTPECDTEKCSQRKGCRNRC